MTVIDTSTAGTATAWSNQRKIDRCQNGVLWTMFAPGLSGLEFWYSTDNGATFTQDTGASLSNIGSASLFIDLDDYAHLAYNFNGIIYYRRGTPNAARTAWTWSAATTIASDSGVEHAFPDVVAHREGTGWTAHIVWSLVAAGNGAWYRPVTVSSGGTITAGTRVAPSGYGNTNHTYPSIDFHHTGDGKTVAGSTPHLFVGLSAGATGSGKGIRFRKATYSGGSWTWGTEREIDSDTYIIDDATWLNCLFDGTRVIMPGTLYSTSFAHRRQMLYDVNASTGTLDTTRDVKGSAVASVDPTWRGSGTYDGDGNVYFLGLTINATTKKVGYRKWTRSTASLGSNVYLADLVEYKYLSGKRGHSNQRIEFIYTDGASSPYSVMYGAITLNQPPNAPGSLSPDGTTIDRTATNRFTWSFSDPDSGDSQSGADLRYRTVGSSTWTTVNITSPNSFYDFPGGTFTAGDWEWQVRTYDASGAVGPYSSSAFFTAASPPSAPSITDPIAGQTIDSETYTVHWSTPSQSAYQLRTVADDAGSPDTSTVYTDTGEVTSTSARSRTVSFATNNREEHIQVRVKSDGLWSTWASINVTVSYTPPATPTVTLTAGSPTGAISVDATHPAPGTGQPTVTSMDVHRRVAAEGGDGIQLREGTGLAPGATFVDYAVNSGVEFEYRVRAYGDNGTSTYSAWTP